MITISKKANPNYLCKVVKLSNLRKHGNADRLQIATIDFQDVITGLEAKDGDVYVYFPVESKINSDFLSYTNSFRKKELNYDLEKVGFFEENCRVRAVKLRGEKSMGYIVPLSIVMDWVYGSLEDMTYSSEDFGKEFDTIGGKLLVEKYQIPVKETGSSNKQGKAPLLSRLVEGQVHLHADTENLRKNIHKLELGDTVSITYKTHGTSWWAGNLLVKRQLNLFERLLKWFGVIVSEQEYDTVYGSRKVVKNKHFDPKGKDHFFGYDLWEDVKNRVGEIPKGYTLYGECLGYTKGGAYIQEGYDYRCTKGSSILEVYRITHTTPDGLVTELSYPEIVEFCERLDLTPSTLFYYGTIRQFIGQQEYKEEYHYMIQEDNLQWREYFIKTLEEKYNEKDCMLCDNKVPEEGIVVRKESLFSCESYKLKSFRFLEYETKELDKGEINIEDNE